MDAPLIGITTYRSLRPTGFHVVGMVEAYITALVRAGATPLLIPLGLPQENLLDLLSHLDGVLFSGGGDIHPARYGGELHARAAAIDEQRDQEEITLAQAVVERRLPFLGICRGLQLVNVALGGSLYEDIALQRPASIQHDYYNGRPRNYLAHPVHLESDSRLYDLWQVGTLEVNSLHHQGIRQLAPGLRAVGRTPDGLVEALELPDHPFGLAVQWHPEWLQEQLAMRLLFQAFVQAAKDERGECPVGDVAKGAAGSLNHE